MRDISEFIIHEELVENHKSDGLRSGEGSIATLSDGSLFFVYGSFEGKEDHDKATLFSRRSTDGGLSWTGRDTFLKPTEDILNLMSVSMLTLQDGTISMTYLRKESIVSCVPLFSVSSDNGMTWSDPVVIDNSCTGYYEINNDRMIQLKDGRIVLPYAVYKDAPCFGGREGLRVCCGCFFSDNGGKSWSRSDEEIILTAEDIVPPKHVDPEKFNITKEIKIGIGQSEEPGVVELSDGRLMLWCRTGVGYAYRAYSEDRGNTFSSFTPIVEFAMPKGPQSIKVLPHSERLIMLYNDRGELPFGHPQFMRRSPLSLAISDDNGVSWKKYGELESGNIPSNCYFSICFHKDNILFSYYEGNEREAHETQALPEDLASLKLKIIKQDYFRQDLP